MHESIVNCLEEQEEKQKSVSQSVRLKHMPPTGSLPAYHRNETQE